MVIALSASDKCASRRKKSKGGSATNRGRVVLPLSRALSTDRPAPWEWISRVSQRDWSEKRKDEATSRDSADLRAGAAVRSELLGSRQSESLDQRSWLTRGRRESCRYHGEESKRRAHIRVDRSLTLSSFSFAPPSNWVPSYSRTFWTREDKAINLTSEGSSRALVDEAAWRSCVTKCVRACKRSKL